MLEGNNKKPTFIDLFAGCGGLSLGLAQANWQGIFAVEKAVDAFATFKKNLLYGPADLRFAWPDWLDERALSIDDVLKGHEEDLERLEGMVDVVVGGPPCQGFSFSGRRKKYDPRNRLFESYVQFIRKVQPRAVILENVPGMQVVHGGVPRTGRRVPGPVPKSYYDKLVAGLDAAGYVAEGRVLEASGFGVPQRRLRLVVIGLQKAVAGKLLSGISEVFSYIDQSRRDQLQKLHLPQEVSAFDAISDLATEGKPLIKWVDSGSTKGLFCHAPTYDGPNSDYQALMHAGFGGGQMDSIRLARHRPEVIKRFKLILLRCPKGINLRVQDRERFQLLKHRTHPMDPNRPAPTVMTLPDDILHYAEPRILSVRECARLQSFPDWFKFLGKYTTGGLRRRLDCPRYTQIGNAVPPLLARAIGIGVARALVAAEAPKFQASSVDLLNGPRINIAATAWQVSRHGTGR